MSRAPLPAALLALAAALVLPVGATHAHTVPADSPLIPRDSSDRPLFTTGQSFRLLFRTTRYSTATSPDIETYNSFVQAAAAARADLASFSGGFRALISTAKVDARNNTATIGAGVPIYWINGRKVADNYADFYDGTWDFPLGTNEHGHDAVWTGSKADGTKHATNHAGSRRSQFGHTAFRHTHLSYASGWSVNTSPLYGLSPVVTVAATSDNTRPAKPSGLTARASDRQVNLMWNDPSDSTITKYQFQLKAGTGNYGDWTDVPGTTSHIVSNLTNGITYTFKIRAVDAGGVGTESNAVTAKPADTTPPAITGLTFGTFIGRGIDIYVVGDRIPIYVNFTEDVTVVGTPTLTINIGGVTRTAAYTPFGSSGDSKVFQYTVQHSDKDTDGISVDAGSIALARGASIKDAANHAAVLTHSGLATQSDHKVDGVRRPAKPSFFTASPGNGQVKLSWANHYDPTVTKFQYKQKSGGGSYPTAWTDIPVNSVTNVRCGIKIHSSCVGSQFYVVSNLTNGIAYTFKTRAWDASSNYGRESDETTATPAVPALTARVSQAPTEHRGKGKFVVRVAFSEAVAGRAKDAAATQERAHPHGAGSGHALGGGRTGARGDRRQHRLRGDPEPGGLGRGDGTLRDEERHGEEGQGLSQGQGHARVCPGRDREDHFGGVARRREGRGRGDLHAGAEEGNWRGDCRRRGGGHHRQLRPAAAGVAGALRPDGGDARDGRGE